MSSSSTREKAHLIQQQYYEDHKKHRFFKNTQKVAITNEIVQQIPLNDLIQETVYIVDKSVIMDYTAFKLYGNPDNYVSIFQAIIQAIEHCIQNYGTYDLHVNLDSFTVSAFERHKTFIGMFNADHRDHLNRMNQCYIHNTPHFMDVLRKWIVLYSGKEAAAKVIFEEKGRLPKGN